MGKLDEAKTFLKQIGMPEQQQNDICAYSLLTLAGIRPDDKWTTATNEWIRIHDILGFTMKNYGHEYAENTRETIRKNCMHQFRDGALIEDNGKATNSPNYRYRITAETLALIRLIGTAQFDDALKRYHSRYERLVDKYASKKRMEMMSVFIKSIIGIFILLLFRLTSPAGT